MTARVSFRLLSVAALLAVGAQAAAAQIGEPSNIASSGHIRWVESPTGEYHLELAVPYRTNKVNLTITDSSGALAANFQPVGDPAGHPLTAFMEGDDMILQADTPRGLFQIVLRRQYDRVNGTWTLGAAKGAVKGRVAQTVR